MKQTAITQRLQGLGGAKWEVHLLARQMARQGLPMIMLTIGEPDIPTPPALIESAYRAMTAGRTGYSDGRGEIGLRKALAARYAGRTQMDIQPDQFLCLPGTQSALFLVLLGMVEAGDELLVGDPMYATYEGLIRATGASIVPVPLRPENGFRLQASDVERWITPRTKGLLINTPHNPTGAILSDTDIAPIAALAQKHDFGIISDEVYEEMIFTGRAFASPFTHAPDHTVVVSSISKSHAAPGFRSGWCLGAQPFIEDLLPVAEAMLFGNQPFIADMTEQAVRDGSSVVAGMSERFARRSGWLAEMLHGQSDLRVHQPDAGMFALVDVSATGMDGEAYAHDLLQHVHVAVMPGGAFGDMLQNWVRVALTTKDEDFQIACGRIVQHAKDIKGRA